MAFTQLSFLFFFLPPGLLVHAVLPARAQKVWLLVLSLLFIAWGVPQDVILLAGSVVFNFLTGRQIERFLKKEKRALARSVLISGVAVDLALLFFYKYDAFLWENLNALFGLRHAVVQRTFPIGLSFFTFSVLSYLFDVWQKKSPAARNFLDFALFVTFFAKIVSGPIQPYHAFCAQMENRAVTRKKTEAGVGLFVIGLAKKVLLSGALGTYFTMLSDAEPSNAGALLRLLMYAFMLYFDFSGYSDMAIGLGECFGVSLPNNFDHPYCAESMTDFWRRWHISLGAWFRDYVYIPLGGNRKGKARTMVNLAAVWVLTGLWHGAAWTFVLWGVYHLLLLLAEKFVFDGVLEKTPRILKRVMTFALSVFGWSCFFCETPGELRDFIRSLFGAGCALTDPTARYALLSGGVVLLIAFFAATPYPARMGVRLAQKHPLTARLLQFAMTAVLLVACIAFLLGDTFSAFLYAQF